MNAAYAIAAFGEQRTPWRATMQEAWADAVDAGLGERDEYREFAWLHAYAQLWSTMEPVETAIRDLRSLRPHAPPLGAVGMTGIERIIARREAAEREVGRR